MTQLQPETLVLCFAVACSLWTDDHHSSYFMEPVYYVEIQTPAGAPLEGHIKAVHSSC